MKITIGMQNSIHLDLHREDEFILHELAKTHRSVLACKTGHLITIHTGGIYKICMGKQNNTVNTGLTKENFLTNGEMHIYKQM